MANRNTLAVNKLEDFKQWLIENGWRMGQPKGNYEVLRARKETEKLPLIVYKKDIKGLIHLSVSDWNLQYVKQFINSKKQTADLEEAKHQWAELSSRVEELEARIKPLIKFIDNARL